MTPKKLPEKALQLIAEGAVLLDVRTPEEFQQGHPDHALNIPLEQLPQRLAEVGPPGTKVVLYCADGVRSKKAELLKFSGFPDLFPVVPL